MKTTKNLNIWLAMSAMSMFLLLMVSTAVAQTIYVDADANGVNDGSSWANAYNYLQDALAAAGSEDEIWVAQGIYKPDQGIGITSGDRTATFQLINGVAIRGGYAGFGEPDPNARDIDEYETILSGDLDGNDVDVNDPCDLLDEPTRDENSFHVVTGSNTDSNAVLDSFTITGGNANLVDIHFYRGGGMLNDHGSPSITNCIFIRNSACTGGGMYSKYSNNQILTNCTFIGNSARWFGGGMSNAHSYVILTHCTFSENSAGVEGGGLFNQISQSMLMNCKFNGNSSYRTGGGVYIDYGNLSSLLTNCMFVGNFAVNYGGAMFNGLSDLTLVNCTLVGNSAGNEGGGLLIPPLPVPSGGPSCKLYYGTCTTTNCIFWNNSDSAGMNESSQIKFHAYPPVVNYSCIQGWTGDLGGAGNIEQDPCFAEPNNGDYHLKSQAGRWEPSSASWVQDAVTSPCIDAGDPLSPIGLEPFPNGGVINMGAYGGTAEGSKSYFGEPLCETIIAGDINGDCKVNFLDFRIMALHWLEER